MGKIIKKLDMTPTKGTVKDINLYVVDEKNLYRKSHNHTFFELMLITQGKMRQVINGEERILSENIQSGRSTASAVFFMYWNGI